MAKKYAFLNIEHIYAFKKIIHLNYLDSVSYYKYCYNSNNCSFKYTQFSLPQSFLFVFCDNYFESVTWSEGAVFLWGVLAAQEVLFCVLCTGAGWNCNH